MHLLDINVWLSLAFQRHKNHLKAAAWYRATEGDCCFCRLTQAGFLRLATNPAAMGPAAVSMADAWRAYDSFFADPRAAFVNEPENLEPHWRALTQMSSFSPKVWNDAYLAAFASCAGLEIVTFDRGFEQFKLDRCMILT